MTKSKNFEHDDLMCLVNIARAAGDILECSHKEESPSQYYALTENERHRAREQVVHKTFCTFFMTREQINQVAREKGMKVPYDDERNPMSSLIDMLAEHIDPVIRHNSYAVKLFFDLLAFELKIDIRKTEGAVKSFVRAVIMNKDYRILTDVDFSVSTAISRADFVKKFKELFEIDLKFTSEQVLKEYEEQKKQAQLH